MSRASLVRREEKADFFVTQDGRQVARLYAEPKNVKNAAGEWVPIDPTLVRDGTGWRNRAGRVTARFAASSGAAATTTLEVEGRTVSASLEGAAARPATVDGPQVTYAGVLPGTDLVYRAAASGVKEELVLTGPPTDGRHQWRFPLQTDGLTPRLNDTGSVSLLDEAGTELVHLPAPQVWDSKVNPRSGEPSYGPARFALSQEPTEWVLTVDVNAAWLYDRARVYPVHVDPSWWYPGRNSGRDDAFVMSAYPKNNYNVSWNSTAGLYENKIGRYDSTTGETRTFQHFDLRPLYGAQILGATWRAYFHHAYPASGATWFRVQHLNCGFGVTTVTWNAQPCLGGAYADSSVGRGQWAGVDLTGMVDNQVNGRWPDLGYMVYAGTALNDWKKFASAENGGDIAPFIEVLHNWPPNPVSVQPGSPCNGCSYHSRNIWLAGSATDPNGDALQYFYRVARGPDAESDVVWESGWVGPGGQQIPQDRLRFGTKYYWHAYVSDGHWMRTPEWVWSFQLTNTAPPAVPLSGASPADKAVISSTTPTLSTPAVTDAEGDPVRYWFTVATGPDAASGQVANSGWVSAPTGGAPVTWAVPAGVLKDGVAYTWSVRTTDDLPGPDGANYVTAGPVSRFTVDQRLGASGPTPKDTLGPAGVNLFNGNLIVSAASPGMTTVGGQVGLSFTYNSAATAPGGLTAAYYDGFGTNGAIGSTDAPVLVRSVAGASEIWGAGGPGAPAGQPVVSSALGVDNFRARYTGYLTAPATGTYAFTADNDDILRMWVGGTKVVDEGFGGLAWPASGLSLTGGKPVPVRIEFAENGGNAGFTVWTRSTDAGIPEQPLPASWLAPTPGALPTGWTLSADADGDGGYVTAEINEASVVLTDFTGSAHTYLVNGSGGYTPPIGEEGVLTRDAAGLLTLHDSDGRTYTFDASGHPQAVTAPVDDRKPAAAQYTWEGSPSRLTRITDPVSDRAITLTYGGGNCPPPAPGADPVPPGMLCAIDYPDGARSLLHYKSGALVRIEDPGGEVTDFGYTGGRLTWIREPLAMDWIAAGGTDGATPPRFLRDTDATKWMIAYDPAGRVQTVRSPEPTGSVPASGTARAQHTYSYDTAAGTSGTTRIEVAGLAPGTAARTVTMDADGRPTADADATGAATTSQWNTKDQLVWSTDPAGRRTSTAYDEAGNPTDTYGPAPAGSCIDDAGAPVGSCPVPVPHTRTEHDGGLIGLGATWWANTTMTGVPAAHSTTDLPALTATPPHPALPTAGYSGRLTGQVKLDAGTYRFTAAVPTNGDDGVRVFLDDQLVLDRWDTLKAAVTADRPAGYWRLGDPAGTATAADSSGNNRPLPVTATTFGATGAAQADPDTAARFDGATSWIGATNAALLHGATKPGIEAWFNTTTRGVIAAYQNNLGGTPSDYVPALYVDTHGYLRGRFWPSDGNGTTSPVKVNDGAWHHVALVASGTASDAVQTLFLDGKPVDQATGSVNWTSMTAVVIGTGYSTGWPDTPGGWFPFNGTLDEVAVYRDGLDAGRIAAHYAAGKADFTSGTNGPNHNGAFTLDGAWHRLRIDHKNPTGPAGLTLTATNTATGSVTAVAGTRLGPRYGLATKTTTDDTGGPAPAEITTTGYSDPGRAIDPALGLATSTTVDPGGLNLTTSIRHEPYNPGAGGSYLRRVGRALPAGDLDDPARRATSTYYGDTQTFDQANGGAAPPCGVPSGTKQSGLLRTSTSPAPATGSAVLTEFVYDILGRTAGTKRGGDSAWTCTNFDLRGRVTKVQHPAFGGSPARTVTYDHGVGGDPLTTSVTDPAGTITTAVDLLGRAVNYTDVWGVVTTTGYDAAGRVTTTSTTPPGGAASTLAYTYDAAGRALTVARDGALLATATYTAGELTAVAYPAGAGQAGNGTTGQLGRDSAGALTGLAWTFPNGQGTVTDTVTRSQAGKVLTSTVTDGNTSQASSYTYDAAGRLLTAAIPRHQLTYSYTAATDCTGVPGAVPGAGRNGNRVRATDSLDGGAAWTTSYCYDGADRLIATTVAGAPAGANPVAGSNLTTAGGTAASLALEVLR